MLTASLILVIVAVAAFSISSFPSPEKGGGHGTRHVVPLSEIVSGGPPPDGIPSIDSPKFVSASNATWLDANYDSVIGINLNGDARAYPLQILVWHEIVNDAVGGVPVAVTYCPLCYATAVYVRQVNGTTVTFGTSGKLYDNNLVMYDRLTNSLWSQIWGQAIAGSQSGQTLKRVPIDVTTWGQWKKLYPNTLVLSRQTGYGRDYSNDPYGAYYFTNAIYFPLYHLDHRLPTKAVVLGLNFGNASKAYLVNDPFVGKISAAYALANQTSPILTDSVGGEKVLVWQLGQIVRFFSPIVNGGTLTFTAADNTMVDTETRSVWNFEGVAISGPLAGHSLTRYASETAFWFAWAAFYPGTSIYGVQ